MTTTAPRSRALPAQVDRAARSRRVPAPPRVRVFEGICDQIRGDLANGVLRPGDKLPPERELAEQLGVGRGAIREALRTLETSGVLELRKGVSGGAFVRAVSAQGLTTSLHDLIFMGHAPLRQLTEVRAHMLGFAVELACARGRPSDFDLIEANIDLTEELWRGPDTGAFLEVVSNYYDLIAAAAHNQVLGTMIGSFAGVIRSIQGRLVGEMPREAIRARHELLVLMRARDARNASALMRKHLEDLHEYILTHCTEDFRVALASDERISGYQPELP